MNENLRIAGNQNYFMGKPNQTEITTTPNGQGEERMRDYNMNGTLIIGCNHGYGNIKTAHFCFKASAEASETAPIFSKDYVKYEDKYYVISEGHKNFLADKIADDDYYILTLAAIAKELGKH